MTRYLDVRPGTYHDSVTLMQASQRVSGEPGVRAAMLAMATDLNVGLLEGMGFDPADAADAGPNDLLVAIDADDDESLTHAVARVDAALRERTRGPVGGTGPGDELPARTVRTAVVRCDASVAVVSTPGRYAFADAMDALESGVPVIVFSDNVPLAQEIRLKDVARSRELLVMGPDCGTAVLGGVGFGFANVVRPGPAGIVAASGTGAQQLMSLLDAAGVGVSHCIGVGGRDMSAEVGAVSTLTALDLLGSDDATEQVVVVGKPPAPDVGERVRERAAASGKPVHFALLGSDQPDLTAVARSVVEAVGKPWTPPRHWPAPQEPHAGGDRHIRGLFSGGSLCYEAMVVASAALGPVRSNIPIRPEWALPAGEMDKPTDRAGGPADRDAEHKQHGGLGLGSGPGHTMVDLGDDVYTRGRPHPMIDGSLRTERIRAGAADPACGVLLLDVVLGHGAHPDPAGELASAVVEARERARSGGRDLAVVVSLVGTADDPQDLDRQAKTLNDAGASVHLSNAAAAREAVRLVRGAR